MKNLQTQEPVLVQTQKLKINPYLLQNIKLMSLPLNDLKERIEEELERNPALEAQPVREDISLDSLAGRAERSVSTIRSSYSHSGDSGKQQFIENTLSSSETLHEHLIFQLRVQALPAEDIATGEMLIYNLDENGFYIEDPRRVLPKKRAKNYASVQRIIQQLDPIGCCVHNFRESLEVQARYLEEAPAILPQLIRNHLERLATMTSKELARVLDISEFEILEALHVLKNLSPYPGREFSAAPANYLTPDVLVKKIDNEFRIVVNSEELPRLVISDSFGRLSESERQKQGREESKFITSHMRDARDFIHGIQLRQDTLKRCALAIVEFQSDFFIRGPKGIVPLTLKDIARELSLHEATISRLTRGKYMQTDFGIYSMKYFFTNGIPGYGTKTYGKVAVKEILREMLEEETSMSDQKLSDALSERGIHIARRTVAKYRGELNILSSYQRPNSGLIL